MRRYLAVDWGTTNLRAWRVGASGETEAECELPRGVSQIPRGEAEAVFERELRPALKADGLPAVMCGMIGSNLGWRETPYVSCPAGKAELAAALLNVKARGAPVRIAPGLKCDGITGAPDVMRGEETQLIGWIALDPARQSGRHIVCHPGTHAKWALIEEARVVSFVTAMTGELFDLLSKHSVLRSNADADDGDAFAAGVDAAGDGGALTTRLFSARARVVGGGADPASTRSYLSGLLIGAEIAALARHFGVDDDGVISVLGAPDLCAHYQRALAQRGYRAAVSDGAEAALAGMSALVELGALDDVG